MAIRAGGESLGGSRGEGKASHFSIVLEVVLTESGLNLNLSVKKKGAIPFIYIIFFCSF